MIAPFRWHLPVDLHFGVGCSDALAGALGDREAVVLAYEPAESLGVRVRWQAALGGKLRRWVVAVDGLSSIGRSRELAAEVWPHLDERTVLIGLGGGTTLDLAKVLRCRPDDRSFDALAAALRGTSPWPPMSLAPLWLVPTTAGTGSEVTPWATVWDTDAVPPRKLSLDEPWGHAERAFVDPRLTLTCPAGVTRDTALDTLAHALESLWNRHANPVSRALAISAARRVITHLPPLLGQLDDLVARASVARRAGGRHGVLADAHRAGARALLRADFAAGACRTGRRVRCGCQPPGNSSQGRSPATDAALVDVFDCPAPRGLAAPAGLAASAWGSTPSPAAFEATRHHRHARSAFEAALDEPKRGRNFIGAT